MAQARQKDTKTALHDAALHLFAARGYGGVSMRDIADAVGIRQGAIYNHFKSKQDLLVEVMNRHMEAVLSALDDALAPAQSPAAKLEEFARFHATYHIDYADNVFIAYMELRSLEPQNLADIRVLRDRYEDALSDILTEGKASGAFSIENPRVHARAVLAMLTGVTVWYREGGPMGRREVVENYVLATMQSVGIPYKPKLNDGKD